MCKLYRGLQKAFDWDLSPEQKHFPFVSVELQAQNKTDV